MTGRVRLYACIAAANHGTTLARVLGAAQSRIDVRARWEVWQRLRDEGFSTTQIGRWTNRDHSTVIYGLKQIEEIRRGGLGRAPMTARHGPSTTHRGI